MFDISLVLFENIGLLAFVAVIYTIVPRRFPTIPHPLLVGVLCGLGAVLAMLKPIDLGNGVILDTRGTMIMLSGLFGGPYAALISTVIASALRIYMGGLGTLSGVAWIITTGLLGTGVYWVLRPQGVPVTQKALLIAALLVPLPSATVFLLPWQYVVHFFTVSGVPLSIAQMLGVYLLGMILLQEDERRAAERRIEEQAVTDELSHLPNRRAFYARLAEEWQRHTRYKVPYSVLMLDIDRFKSINDRYGHQVGDAVIAHLGEILRQSCRMSDLPARVGGEEFAILLTHTEPQAAALLAERIRRKIEEADCVLDTQKVPYTVSVGVSSSEDFPLSPDEVLSAADAALYDSKRLGRNRVSVANTTLAETVREVNTRVALSRSPPADGLTSTQQPATPKGS